MSEPLKPCPFCGETDVSVIAAPSDARSWHGEISCLDCEMLVSSDVCELRPELAITNVCEVWNRRDESQLEVARAEGWRAGLEEATNICRANLDLRIADRLRALADKAKGET